MESMYSWAQHSIDLPGSLVQCWIFWDGTPVSDFFTSLKQFLWTRTTFNSSKTDVVEKLNFLVAVSQHNTSVAEGFPKDVDGSYFVLCIFSKTKM